MPGCPVSMSMGGVKGYCGLSVVLHAGVMTLTLQAGFLMSCLSIQYRTAQGLRSFDLDYDQDISAVHIDSLVLQAAIQNEFQENLSLRRITDFALGEKAELETIEAVARRIGLSDIQYLTGDGMKQIRIKHRFLYR